MGRRHNNLCPSRSSEEVSLQARLVYHCRRRQRQAQSEYAKKLLIVSGWKVRFWTDYEFQGMLANLLFFPFLKGTWKISLRLLRHSIISTQNNPCYRMVRCLAAVHDIRILQTAIQLIVKTSFTLYNKKLPTLSEEVDMITLISQPSCWLSESRQQSQVEQFFQHFLHP